MSTPQQPSLMETSRAETPPPLPIPDNMDAPPSVELRRSRVAQEHIGVWCKQPIAEGTSFGPFKGEKLMEAKDDTDPNYVWEILDLETKELLFLIDATRPESSNWMRYVHCARYFEEQNIVSEQDGIDIFYKATKFIHPGEELLTWYENIQSKKGQGRKGQGRKATGRVKTRERSCSPDCRKSSSKEAESDGSKNCSPVKIRSPRKLSPLVLDNSIRTSVVDGKNVEDEEEDEDDEEEEENDDDLDLDEQEDGESGSGSNDTKEDGRISGHAAPPEPGKFQFLLRNHHSTKSRHGRKVYKCDICSGVYRHAFSLKRHYIRNHINLKYVSRADILNCQINPEIHELVLTSAKVRGFDSSQANEATVSKDCQVKTEDSKLNGTSEKFHCDSKDVPTVGSTDSKDGKCEDLKANVEKRKELESSSNSNSANSGSTWDEKVSTTDQIESCSETGEDPEKTQVTPNESSDNSNNGAESKDHGKDIAAEEGCSTMAASDGDSKDCDKSAKSAASESQKCNRSSQKNRTVSKACMPGLYRCNVCNQLFDDLAELKGHISNHPNVPTTKAFACDQCDMKFSHKQNLMRHLAVHTGEKPFTCKFCGKKFPTATNQKRHERIHLGRRVNCDYCSSTFTQSGDLKKHIRKLHPECFHECSFCGKYFTDADELCEHVVSHDETLQSNEAEGNRRRDAFRVDMEMDRMESMRLAEQKTPGYKFACTVCKKRFHDYANMCRHRRLAHQRHVMTGRGSDPSSPIPSPTNLAGDMLDGHPQSFFYANVAQNISENLKYYIEGTKDQLVNTSQHIVWKGSTQSPLKDPSGNLAESQKEDSSFSTYNFPPGFTLKQNYRKVVDNKVKKPPVGKTLLTEIDSKGGSNLNGVSLNVPMFTAAPVTKREVKVQPVCTVQPIQRQTSDAIIKQLSPTAVTLCVKQTLQPGSKQSASSGSKTHTSAAKPTAPPSGKQTTSPSSKTGASCNSLCSSLKVPQFHVCPVCRRVFNNNIMFQEHVLEKHKQAAETMSEKSPQKEKSYTHQSVKTVVKCEPEARCESPLNLSGKISFSRSLPSRPKTGNVPTKTLKMTTKDPAPEQDARLLLDFALGICGDSNVREPKKVETQMPLDLSRSPDGSTEEAPVPTKGQTEIKNEIKSPSTEAPTREVSPAHSGSRMAKVQGLLRIPSFNMRKTIPPPIPTPANMPQSPWQPHLPDSRGRVGHKKFICKVCFAEYRDITALYTHQGEAHPSVSCNHVEVDVDVDAPWWSRPSPIGMLNVCSSQVPDNIAAHPAELSCTKCQQSFSCTEDLHKHIVECAVIDEKKMVSSIKNSSGCPSSVDDEEISRNGAELTEPTTMADSSDMTEPTTMADSSDMDTSALPMENANLKTSFLMHLKQTKIEQDNLKKRRRNFELLYNPQNHVRRREMTEVLDMHRCRGCGYRFSTISLLERHIRVCTQKDRLKEITVSRTPSLEGAVEQCEMKHLCRYCDKPFTYPGSLRKHVLEVCPRRKARLASHKALDVDWEQDMMAQCSTSKDSSLGLLDEGSMDAPADDAISVATSTSSRDTEVDGNGLRRKRKGKRKNHGWGNVKKKRSSSDAVDFTPELVDDSWLPDEADSDDNALVIDEDVGCDAQSMGSRSDCSNVSLTDNRPDDVMASSSFYTSARPHGHTAPSLLSHIDSLMSSSITHNQSGDEPCVDGLRMLSESALLISNLESASVSIASLTNQNRSKSASPALPSTNQGASLMGLSTGLSTNQNTAHNSSPMSHLGVQQISKTRVEKAKKSKTDGVRKGPERVKSPSKMKPERVKSPSKVKPERVKSPSKMKPERVKSPSKVKPERVKSPSKVKPERVKSPSKVKPERVKSPSKVRKSEEQVQPVVLSIPQLSEHIKSRRPPLKPKSKTLKPRLPKDKQIASFLDAKTTPKSKEQEVKPLCPQQTAASLLLQNCVTQSKMWPTPIKQNLNVLEGGQGRQINKTQCLVSNASVGLRSGQPTAMSEDLKATSVIKLESTSPSDLGNHIRGTEEKKEDVKTESNVETNNSENRREKSRDQKVKQSDSKKSSGLGPSVNLICTEKIDMMPDTDIKPNCPNIVMTPVKKVPQPVVEKPESDRGASPVETVPKILDNAPISSVQEAGSTPNTVATEFSSLSNIECEEKVECQKTELKRKEGENHLKLEVSSVSSKEVEEETGVSRESCEIGGKPVIGCTTLKEDESSVLQKEWGNVGGSDVNSSQTEVDISLSNLGVSGKVLPQGVAARDTVLEAREFIDSSDDEGFVVEIEKWCRKPKRKGSKFVIVKLQTDAASLGSTPPPTEFDSTLVAENQTNNEKGPAQKLTHLASKEKSKDSVKRSKKAKCKSKKTVSSEEAESKPIKTKRSDKKKVKLSATETKPDKVASKVTLAVKKKKSKKAASNVGQDISKQDTVNCDTKVVRSKRSSTSANSAALPPSSPLKKKGKQKQTDSNPEDIKKPIEVEVAPTLSGKKKLKKSVKKPSGTKKKSQVKEISGVSETINAAVSSEGSTSPPEPKSKSSQRKFDVASSESDMPKVKESQQQPNNFSAVKVGKKRVRGGGHDPGRVVVEQGNSSDTTQSPAKKIKRCKRATSSSNNTGKATPDKDKGQKVQNVAAEQNKRGKGGGKSKEVPKTRASPGKSARSGAVGKNSGSANVPAKTLRSRALRPSI